MKVDILMATYNGEKYIKEQIDSILNQTHKDFILHISDDKSTDNTRKILKEYAKKDNRIVLHFQKKNLGYEKNFEYLTSIATSSYIMFSDQDDVWLEDKVEKSLKKLIDDKLDLVIGNRIIVDKNLKVINPSYYRRSGNKLNDGLTFKDFLLRNPATGCTMIFRKSLLKRIIPFPNLKKHYIYDWYIYMIGHAYGKVGYLLEPYIKFRMHDSNSVGMNRKNKLTIDYIRKVRSINLNYRIAFCNELLKKIHNEKRKDIIDFKNYLLKLKKTKFINLNIGKFFRYSKVLALIPKLRILIPFHFPLFILNKESGEE